MKNNEFSFKGIGTHWWIKIFDENISDIENIFTQIETIVREFEKNYSRFDDNSYIGRLNREKIINDFPNELYQMFIYAEKIKNLTQNNFNIAIGKVLENLGYDKDYSFQKNSEDLNISKNSIIELSNKEIQIDKDSRIDLGGIGKGWLIDKIKNFLIEKDIKYFYINGGGDIYSQTENPEKFLLENPFDNSESIGYIEIQNESIACSSPSKRRWFDNNTKETHHHLISASTLHEINEISAVFTQTKTATAADTASTAIFVSPPNLLNEISKEIDVEYLLVFPTGQYYKSENYKGVLNTA